MLDSLKTNDKFNPYLIAIPAFAVLSAWQVSQICVGLGKLGHEYAKNKKNNK